MAVKALGVWAQKDIDFSAAIESCMKRKKIDGKGIAKRLCIGYTTHRRRINNPETMTVGELRDYIKILDIPEEDVLDALYLHREKK